MKTQLALIRKATCGSFVAARTGGNFQPFVARRASSQSISIVADEGEKCGVKVRNWLIPQHIRLELHST